MDAWTEFFTSGSSFLLAVITWIWYAGKLVTKLNALDEKIKEHLKAEEKVWEENQNHHQKIRDKIDEVSDDVAYLRGKISRNGDFK